MKYTNTARTICAALLITAAMTACADSASPVQNPDSPNGSSSDTAETQAVSNAWNDHLPARDFTGQQFRISVYGNESCTEKFFVSDLTGNLVNDAVYNKIAAVEDRFNVDIVFNDVSSFIAEDIRHLMTAVLAGDDTCELAQGHDITSATASLEGVFMNVLELPYLDFDQPWWSSHTVESMTVAGQMYLMLNNIAYTSLAQTRVMFFNKTMLSNLNLPDPYQLVYDGEWILENLRVMSNAAYSDINGDSKKDNDDIIGYAHGENYCILETYLIEPYTKDSDGNLCYEMDVDRLHSIAMKLGDVLYGAGGLVAGGETRAEKIFSDGRALFIYTNLYAAASNFSQSDDLVYGLLPFPKLDESQTYYGGGATDRPIVIPITAADRAEFVGIITEALNIEGYRQVYPAYFEVTMKSRYADGTDDAKMLDIIHDNTVISFTYLYGKNKSAYNVMLNDLFRNKNKMSSDVASWAAKHESAQSKYVAELAEFFSKNK